MLIDNVTMLTGIIIYPLQKHDVVLRRRRSLVFFCVCMTASWWPRQAHMKGKHNELDCSAKSRGIHCFILDSLFNYEIILGFYLAQYYTIVGFVVVYFWESTHVDYNDLDD